MWLCFLLSDLNLQTIRFLLHASSPSLFSQLLIRANYVTFRRQEEADILDLLDLLDLKLLVLCGDNRPKRHPRHASCAGKIFFDVIFLENKMSESFTMVAISNLLYSIYKFSLMHRAFNIRTYIQFTFKTVLCDSRFVHSYASNNANVSLNL